MPRPWTAPTAPTMGRLDLARPVDYSHPLARGLVTLAAPWLAPLSRVRDLSDRGNTGTPAGTLLYARIGDGNGIYHDSASYVTFAKKVTELGVTNAFSVSWRGWITNINTRTFFVGQYQQSDPGYDWGLYINNSNLFYVFVKNSTGTGVSVGAGVTPALLTPYALGLTYDGAKLRCYLGGAERGTAADLTGNVAAGFPFKLGHYWGVTVAHPRAVTESLAVWNRALSSREMQTAWAPQTRWGMLRITTGRVTVRVPALPITLTPAAAEIPFGSSAPLARLVLPPAAAVVSAAGVLPRIGVTFRPAAAAVNVADPGPHVLMGLTPAPATVPAAGVAPACRLAVTPAPATVPAAGVAPSIRLSLLPTAGVVTLAPASASMTLGLSIAPASLTMDSVLPALGVRLSPSAAVVTASATAGGVRLTIGPSACVIVVSGLEPSVVFPSDSRAAVAFLLLKR